MNRVGSIGDFYHYVDGHTHVSFDIFDTLIYRKLLKVNEVHDTVSAYALTQVGKRRTNSPFDMTLLRYRMTDVLKNAGDGGNQEPPIDMIWDYLLRRDVPNAIERTAVVEKIVSFELALEQANLRPVAGVIELLTGLKRSGRTIIAISDMYFSLADMEKLLRALGIFEFFDHLYVSSHTGLTKQTGDLFRYVLADLNIQPRHMVHVGDNPRSDVQQATECGITSVLVDQPRLLEVERPDYGHRVRIEEEVADIVKMHIFSLLLDAQDRKLDHIYFMARDGCAIGTFLARWKSPLITRFIPPPESTDLYLNRILSCWGGVDFSGEWLRQAVDLALWLHHDTATPEELCAMLGVQDVPPALGTVPLRADRDPARVVEVFTKADLQGSIKSAIIAKRAHIVRYLEEIKFFEKRAVGFSDVGYSGTVLRDLNSLFLNRSIEENAVSPPHMLLHLIATSDNMAANRVRSFPFVDFATQAVLPADKLPPELKASFAWFEFFFKHPTLLPILRFVEHDGRIEPELRHELAPTNLTPTQRVACNAIERDEDIVLLWMVAVNFTGQIVDPVINRFANPDAQTIAQMQDEVFEQHSVKGTRRSIFLTIPGARVEAISVAAQQGDYWLPGSIAASGAGAHLGVEETAPAPPRPRWFRRWFRPSTPDLPSLPSTVLPNDFDPAFYRDFYSDLRQFTTVEDLWNHYSAYGRRERRLPTYQALVAQLEAEFKTIPADFDGRAYLRLNADLGAHLDSPAQALNHYMRFGRHEGRRYLNVDADLPNAFERLRVDGSIVLSASEEALWQKGEATMALFLRRHGIHAGAWLDDLDAAEFKALNYRWCGPVDSTAACIVALLQKGMDKCPSLSLRAPFDADYYRQQSTTLKHLDDEDLYRHYLNHASREGLHPSEHAALMAVWGRSHFPACLDWCGYQAQIPGLLNASRSVVLAAFIDDPDLKRLDFVALDDAADFLEFLAVRAWQHNGRIEEARLLFQAAMDSGAGTGRIQHQLGDLALQSDQPDQALVHFRKGIDAPDTDLWSYFHAARLLLDHGDYRSALGVLSESASDWQERAPWRRLSDAAMQAKCAAILHSFLASASDQTPLDRADAFMAEIIARAADSRPSFARDGTVLIITSRSIMTSMPVSSPVPHFTVVNPGNDGEGDLVGALLSHETVIFHETRFSHHILRSIALAQSLGKRTVAWLGDLADWEGYPLGACLAIDERQPSVPQLDDLPAFALTARYCDAAVTTLYGCVPPLRQLCSRHEPEIIGVIADNHRGADHTRRVILIVCGKVADIDATNFLATAIALAAKADDKLFFLIPQSIAEHDAFRSVAGRWAVVDDNPDLPKIARLIGTVDAVLHVTDADRAGYSIEAEAAGRGIPANVVYHAPKRASSTWMPRSATITIDPPSRTIDEMAEMIRQMIDQAPSLPSPIERLNNKGVQDHNLIVTQPIKRILFANVFFAPQTIGGATRVLKDNIDYLLDHHRDEFEIAVFTADEQNDHSGEWRIDAYRGIKVYRMATPQERNMDWRAVNSDVGAKFDALLAAFKPDLVHIHCLQRLSVTVAEACRRRSVPYIVTLHDAWWISDFPFLSDHAGVLVTAQHDYYDQERLTEVGIARSILRSNRLRSALMGAARRLSVSESFAEIYRSAGIPCEAVENGVSRIKSVARAAPGARVELCHIGGLQHHKGAYLVEAALRNNEYSNLHFTIVDLARGPGQKIETIWGTTPVTIIGKMTTASLADFYAKMNVLLAPSTWPESYGLVSREALAHGLWVIASKDGGSMADPVVDGRNGFVVSTDGADDLARVLSTIDRDMATYRLSPMTEYNVRSVDDQSRDLIEIYRSIVPE